MFRYLLKMHVNNNNKEVSLIFAVYLDWNRNLSLNKT